MPEVSPLSSLKPCADDNELDSGILAKLVVSVSRTVNYGNR